MEDTTMKILYSYIGKRGRIKLSKDDVLYYLEIVDPIAGTMKTIASDNEFHAFKRYKESVEWAKGLDNIIGDINTQLEGL